MSANRVEHSPTTGVGKCCGTSVRLLGRLNETRNENGKRMKLKTERKLLQRATLGNKGTKSQLKIKGELGLAGFKLVGNMEPHITKVDNGHQIVIWKNRFR